MSTDRAQIDFRNSNTIWCSVLVETLHRLGLSKAILCPGSRSTPLTLAFIQHTAIEALPVLDERSASFFALGIAKRSHQPVALVCTSGTAGSNFYSAVIEARESCVPLLIMTADRPPELRHCNAGQTIDQQKLYGSVPNWYVELAIPFLDESILAYARQTIIHAWERSLFPVAGPVHLNLPFREPLHPQSDSDALAFEQMFRSDWFFSHIIPPRIGTISENLADRKLTGEYLAKLAFPSFECAHEQGVIIAGVALPDNPSRYCQAIARLSKFLRWPVLAEGLSPVRNYAELNPYIVSTYDTILRCPDQARRLVPTQVIRVGEMPTSKVLRQWLEQNQPQQWVIDANDRNLDPTHNRTTHIRLSIEYFSALLPQWDECKSIQEPTQKDGTAFLSRWLEAERMTRRILDLALTKIDNLFEGKIAWMLSQALPANTPLFISNSTPVRDVEWFWKPSDRHVQPFSNRGANGIDGILSTALGMAHDNQRSVLLTGDLAFLHDTNGLLVGRRMRGHLTIILINNNGGGIFEFLPISQYEPPFEDYFATPQSMNFSALCAVYGVHYELVQSWEMLKERLQTLPNKGIRVLEVRCDRKQDVIQRKQLWTSCESG